jgi:hypothetical protein
MPDCLADAGVADLRGGSSRSDEQKVTRPRLGWLYRLIHYKLGLSMADD